MLKTPYGLSYEQLEDAALAGPLVKGPGKPVKEPTTVYRVEMGNGKGPYNSGLPEAHEIYMTICSPDNPDNCIKNAILNRDHMDVTEKAFHEAHGHANYGCDSLEAIDSWFPKGSREYLKQFGGKLVEYLLPVGASLEAVGRGEVIFNRFEANKVGEFDLVGGVL